jgi:hypothetical protein
VSEDGAEKAFSPEDEMLIVEDLMLLLLKDEDGSVALEVGLPSALGGAVLVELALLGRADQNGDRTLLGGRKVLAAGHGPLPDPLLEQGYRKIAERPLSAQSIVPELGDGLDVVVSQRLVDRGLVRAEHQKWLGLIPRTKHPAQDSTYELQLREKIRAVLADGRAADPRTAALIALLSANGTLKPLLKEMTPPLPWSSEVKDRAQRIGKGDLGAAPDGQASQASLANQAQAGVGEAIAAAAAAVAASTMNDLSS